MFSTGWPLAAKGMKDAICVWIKPGQEETLRKSVISFVTSLMQEQWVITPPLKTPTRGGGGDDLQWLGALQCFLESDCLAFSSKKHESSACVWI